MFKTDIVFKRHWEEPKINLEKQNKYKEFLYYSFINDNETISNINKHLFKGTL